MSRDRRAFLRAGGVAGLAGIAGACTSFGIGGGSDDPDASDSPDGVDASEAARADIAFLRTASSLAQYAVAVYDAGLAAAAGGALRLDDEIRDAFGAFRDDHLAHADAFDASAISAGGQAAPEANPAAMAAVAAELDAIANGASSQDDVLRRVHNVELVVADTYLVTGTASLSTPRLRQSALLAAQVCRLHATAFSVLDLDLGLEALPPAGFAGGNEAPSTFYL